ncbi:MAG: FmdB family transcriptional regulator [Leptothrix sp. (in: Bacteria)]|nr:FmdB family transcriptional regulator [Leptothrix sp. (in: b-proteobacteria)]
MPIYAYRCTRCGHAQDVLQKISDPVLTVCPTCGESSFAKQVTAAGFQLKGSGWYVTDFRGGNKPEGDAAKAGGKPGDAAAPSAPVAETQPATPASPVAPAAAPAPAAPAPSPRPSD